MVMLSSQINVVQWNSDDILFNVTFPSLGHETHPIPRTNIYIYINVEEGWVIYLQVRDLLPQKVVKVCYVEKNKRCMWMKHTTGM